MRRTTIVIIAIVLMAILTLVLMMNTKVQNSIVKIINSKELRSYKLLANNGISSSSFEIRSVINGSLHGPVMFDTLHKVFVVGTKRALMGRHESITFWKISTKGQIVDSVMVHKFFDLAEDGLIHSENQYLDWVHTGEKLIKNRVAGDTSHTTNKNSVNNGADKARNTLLEVTSEDMKQFPQVSLKRSYFFKRKQRNGHFISLRPNSSDEVRGYEGPAYFDLEYYGESMKFKAFDFESKEGPKSYLCLWGAPKGYESPKIHFLYLPDIIHLPHYSEVGIYVIRPKGLEPGHGIDKQLNGFFETSDYGQEFISPETDQPLRLNMKTSIPLTEVSSYKAVKIDGQSKISMTLTPRGAALFKAMTRRNIQKTIALVVQGHLISTYTAYATISNGKVDMITFDDEESDYLIELLDEQKD